MESIFLRLGSRCIEHIQSVKLEMVGQSLRLLCTLTLLHITLSLGKCFGSKVKQHRKYIASETQSHIQWSHKCKEKAMQYSQSSSDQAHSAGISISLFTIDLCLPSTSGWWSAVCYYRICQLELEMGQNIISYVFASAWPWALETWCWWSCCR